MGQKQSNNSNRRTLLSLGNILFILLIVFDVYLFFTKTSIIAKSLAVGSFVLLMALLILSVRKIVKLQRKVV